MKKIKIKNFVIYGLLVGMALFWILPLYIVTITPLKSTQDLFSNVYGLPKKFLFSNFLNVWSEIRISLFFRNSVIITAVTIILLLFFASISSYAICRSGWKVTKSVYFLFTVGLMIPTQVGMVTLFLTIKKTGIYNAPAGLILPYIAMSLPIAVFIFVGFFRSLPSAIIESAYIDGCGEFQIYRKIVMPLSTGAASTVIIYCSVSVWNDFTYPLLFTRGDDWKTLPLGIYSMKGQFMSDYPLMFAGIVLATVPILAAYIILQKQFIAGLTAGAVKG
jgi:raffinose/stachyose/melibiose transport system permease protein